MAQNNQQKGQQKVQETSQLEKVRREKLAELQAAGKDPFQIVKYNQTYHSAQIKRDFDELENETVSIAGSNAILTSSRTRLSPSPAA